MADRYLGKDELRFWLPIIISVVSVVMSYAAMVTRIALVEQKQNDILAGINEIKAEIKAHAEAGTGDHNDLIAIKTLLGIK